MDLEVIHKGADSANRSAPLLFVHGGSHAAWCWDEHFLDYFAAHGYHAAALSLRGHGGSESDRPLPRVPLRAYVDDVRHVADTFATRPVLIGHSIGGTIVQLLAQTYRVPAMVLLASNPPTGSRGVAVRALRRHPWRSLVAATSTRQLTLFGSPELAHEWFYAASTPRPLVERYAARLQEESARAVFDTVVTRIRNRPSGLPTLVIGGSADNMISAKSTDATARFYGTRTRTIEGVGHCMMLEPRWESVAKPVLAWLDQQFGPR